MKLLTVTNMYPSSEHKYYGTFVQNMNKILMDELPWLNCRLVSKTKTNSFYKNLFGYLNFFSKTIAQLYRFKPNYVFIHFSSISSVPIVLFNFVSKKRFKLITHCHGTDIYGGKLNRYLSQKAFTISDFILVPSEKVKKDILHTYSVKCDIYVTYSGGIQLPKRSELQKEESKNNILKLGYVSTINEQKGFYTLISALKIKSLRDTKIHLLVAGFIVDQTKFETAVSSLPQNVKITYFGLVPKAELEKVYSNIDVFVFPTQLPESLGLVGLEAMSFGKPVIASNIGAIPEYLSENENGFLFKACNHLELSEKIRHFCTLAEEERGSLSFRAKNTASQFQSNQFRDVINKIITVDN